METDQKKRSVWSTIFPVVLCLLSPLLYILSYGPACWIYQHLKIGAIEGGAHAFNAIYAPLTWTATQTGTEMTLLRYMSLFVDINF